MVSAVPIVVVAALLLAGCAGPDPDEVRSEAEAVFQELVSQAGETDAAILRTLETADPVAEACEGDDRAQTALTATGTLSITAAESEATRLRDALGDSLDPEAWTPIRAAAAEQSAWISEHDVVVTVTPRGPAIVIAVFTPCLTG